MTLTLFLVYSILNVVLCKHWIPKKDDVVHNVHIGHKQDVATQPLTQNLRFRIVYDSSVNILSYDKQRLVKVQLMPAAVTYFHQTLHVRNSTQSIALQRMCLGNSYFLKNARGDGPGHVQYCKLACKDTVCGPTKVSEKFLDHCRVCNEHGNNCRVLLNHKLSPEKTRDTDFILFVSSLRTTHCAESNIVAYASYCQQEHALNRPVAGFANLCPGKLESDPQSFESLLSTVKHEIYHALGFSVGLFAFYRDSNGEPLTERLKHGLPDYNPFNNVYQWSDKIIKSFVRKDWSVSGGYIPHEVQMIVTPKVKREVRRHFKCDDLEGGEIENQGGEGTALTHWEKRVFENEAMTGTYTQHPVFSRITLALMEDTGWYLANYDMAEDLDWGKGLGCLFVKNNCRAWIADQIENGLPTAPYCATLKQSPLHMRCTHTKLSLALCNLVKYVSDLPHEFNYFDRLGHVPVKDINSYGGAVELADFCPFYQKFTLTEEDSRRRGTTCTISENSPASNKNYALETYGSASKCVEHGRHWIAKNGLITRTMLDWGSGCYAYECNENGLFFIIENHRYHCTRPKMTIEVIGWMNMWHINGTLICPSCKEFCGEKYCLSNNALKLMSTNDENPNLDITSDSAKLAIDNVLKLFILIFLIFFIS